MVLAFTPARGGSKGIPRKNIKLFAGKPLIQHTIDVAKQCPLIDHYVVNTEDAEIADLASRLGVCVQGRPEEFWYDNTFQEVDRLLKWATIDMERSIGRTDIVVLLYATSPLRRLETVTDCINLVLNEGYDSALSLCEDRSYLWKRQGQDAAVEPTNYLPERRGPNQLEGWNQWRENKAVYVVKRDLLIDTGCRLGGKIGFVAMDAIDSIDIDKPSDFQLAEMVMSLRANK